MSDINVGTTETGTPSSTPTPAPTGAPAVSSPATSVTPPAPATSGTPDDRSNWIPPYRLREASEAAYRRAQNEFQQNQQQWQREREQLESRVRALAGVSQPTQNTEADQIKQQFFSIFPNAKNIFENAEKLEQLLEKAGDLESQNEHYWQSYGRQQVDRLFSKASEAIGSPLNDEAKRMLHSFFVGYVQSSPENANRYASDPTIVDDFLKSFTSTIIDPSRRQTAAGIVNRAPHALPQDSPAGAPVVPGAPKPQSLDERTALGWAAYQAGRGGQ